MGEITVKKIRELENNIDKNVQNSNGIIFVAFPFMYRYCSITSFFK